MTREELQIIIEREVTSKATGKSEPRKFSSDNPMHLFNILNTEKKAKEFAALLDMVVKTEEAKDAARK